MIVVTNLNKEQHKKVENYILAVNSAPLIFNHIHDYFCNLRKTNISELQVYELKSFKFENETYFLVYEMKKLEPSTEDKIKEFKQLRLL